MEQSHLKFKNIVIENCSRKDFRFREWMAEYHLEIVERIALELCDIYTEANRDIVQALVWFHDFGKPIDEENERPITLEEGPKAMRQCGYPQEFIDKIIQYWQLMEKKNEIDIKTTPIEVQIISSADGASHFTGVFYSNYFGNGHDFNTTQERLKEKIEKDWHKKIALPEVRKAFQARYDRARELYGEFPNKFINPN
ncbi:MAG: hypothetical protein V4665_02000 [Patescibacteria group bacterium]